jgi:hypothetical protein
MPAGWAVDRRPGFADNVWPFSVGTLFRATSGIQSKDTPLGAGGRIIVTGTLWQDLAHGDQGFVCAE